MSEDIRNLARFTVHYKGGPIAWFIAESDARDFIASQPYHDRYEVVVES